MSVQRKNKAGAGFGMWEEGQMALGELASALHGLCFPPHIHS